MSTSQGRVPFVRFSPRCVRFQRAALEAFVQEREVAVSEPVLSATAAYNGLRKQG